MPVRTPLLRDQDLRAAVHDAVSSIHGDDDSTLVLDEFSLCRARARVDVAVVDACLIGYELKSDVDRLDRLHSQVPLYGRVFDRMTLVTGTRHAAKAVTLVPPWWGIWVAERAEDGGFAVYETRAGSANPSVCARSVAGLLWHEEMLEVLATHDAALRARHRSRRQLVDALTEALDFDALGAAVREMLRLRSQRAGATELLVAG